MPGLWVPPSPPLGRGFTDASKTPVTVTSGAANTKGTWTQLIASTAEDAYGFWTYADGMGITATITGGLLDIGFGPAGGSDPGSNVNLVPDWNVGWSGVAAANKSHLPYMQYWPVFIPAGSKVWARLAATIASDTVRVFLLPSKSPHGAPYSYVGPRALAYGIVAASSRGTVVTSGAAVYGSDVSLGTTTRDHKLWAIGIDGGTDTSLSNLGFFLARLRIGSGGPIIGEWIFNVDTTTEMIGGPFPPVPVHKPVPSGSNIHASVNATGTGDSLALVAYGM